MVAMSCSNQYSIYTDQDPAINIRKFTTYQWSNRTPIEMDSHPLYYNELNDKRIKSSVNSALIIRGLILTENNPDILVHYHIMVEDKVYIDLQPYGFTYGRYWANAQRERSYSYREGTLIIDLMEAKTGNLAWRGWAVAVIENDSKKSMNDIIGKAVAEIFSKYPSTNY